MACQKSPKKREGLGEGRRYAFGKDLSASLYSRTGENKYDGVGEHGRVYYDHEIGHLQEKGSNLLRGVAK